MPSDPDAEITLLHNPRCSKSRAARDLLAERGVRFRERHYLEEPLTRAELDALAKRLGQPARAWVRRGESVWAECGLSDEPRDADILDAIAAHPILMERPIAIRGERAVVGRPPQRVLELLP